MHFLGRLLSITIGYTLIIALAERAYTVSIRLYISYVQRKLKGSHKSARPLEDIQSLHAFDYRAVEPIKYRPFEKKQHVVMGMLLILSP